MITCLLIAIALVIAGLLIAAATRSDDLRVERRITLSTPPAPAFGQINDVRKWQEMSPYVKHDPAANYTFSGPAAGVGASVAWAGNAKVGEGRMTVVESRPNELVRFKLEFFKPWTCTNTADFSFRPTPTGTEVTWAMFGQHKFIGKLMGLFMDMDKMIGRDFEDGLKNLKRIAEAGAEA
jgi:hypothetical protein